MKKEKDQTKQKNKILKGKKVKEKNKKTPEKEIKKKNFKRKLSHESKLLINILIISFTAIILVIIAATYFQSMRNPTYKDIKFKAVNLGKPNTPIIMYSTLTLAPSNDGTGSPFGFRIRTKPSELKKIHFDNVKNLNLMRFNAYSVGNESFHCNGDGIIALVNFDRLFKKMGETIIRVQNSTCDPQGRYNSFKLKYGNETEIKQIGKNCYDIVIKGNDNSCEILPATEKVMVELFNKYLKLTLKK